MHLTGDRARATAATTKAPSLASGPDGRSPVSCRGARRASGRTGGHDRRAPDAGGSGRRRATRTAGVGRPRPRRAGNGPRSRTRGRRTTRLAAGSPRTPATASVPVLAQIPDAPGARRGAGSRARQGREAGARAVIDGDGALSLQCHPARAQPPFDGVARLVAGQGQARPDRARRPIRANVRANRPASAHALDRDAQHLVARHVLHPLVADPRRGLRTRACPGRADPPLSPGRSCGFPRRRGRTSTPRPARAARRCEAHTVGST